MHACTTKPEDIPKSGIEDREATRVDESYNSKYSDILNENEQKILKAIQNSPYPITPKEIADITGINHNTVKVCVRKLARLKFVHNPYYGHYERAQNVITPRTRGLDGLCFERERLKPCVHSLQFVVRCVGRVPLEREVCLGGLVRVRFHCFSNGTVVVYVDGEFDAVSFPLLVEFLKLTLEVTEDQIVPKQVEFNNDIQGLQLEGANCLTVKGVQGDLIRLYNKDKHTVRREIKSVHLPRTVAEIDTLIQGGGLPSYYILQGVGRLVSRVEELFEAQKFNNRTQGEFLQWLKVIAQKLLKEES